ncbi:ribonuclease H-like protein [Nemania sp. NC0429]|nr:ribonuclease H-like protein [Nemania sp. NC0429]
MSSAKATACGLLDTTEAIAHMVDTLVSGLPSLSPSIYIDLEGVNLSRHGTISILQIYHRSTGQSYLVDVKTLGEAAFSTRGTIIPMTLKAILELASIPKAIFDVRNDSDALYAHFGIRLQGMHDIQLMEYATRTYQGKFLCGLKKCIERDMSTFMTTAEKHNWIRAKEEGVKLFDPAQGGSYEVFNQRPLPEKIRVYCVQDVAYLPRLWDLYNGKLNHEWGMKVREETKNRVVQSQGPGFGEEGKSKALPPKGWERR